MKINTNRIFSNGKHNAFTTMMYFRGHYYVAFRTAKEHHHSKSRIKVLRSYDLKSWEEYSQTKKIKDLRDPQFKGGTLFCVKPRCKRARSVWYVRDLEVYLGNVFKKKIQLFKSKNLKSQYWPWVIKEDFTIEYKASQPGPVKVFHKKKYFSIPSFIYTTETDGIKQGNEFLFIERNDYGNSHIVRGKGKKWRTYETEDIHCPRLFEWENKTYVVGRKANMKADTPKVCIWQVFENRVKLIKTLPSGGDCGYPGVIVEKDRVLISYYSQHTCGFDEKKPKRIHKADIFLTEIT